MTVASIYKLMWKTTLGSGAVKRLHITHGLGQWVGLTTVPATGSTDVVLPLYQQGLHLRQPIV